MGLIFSLVMMSEKCLFDFHTNFWELWINSIPNIRIDNIICVITLSYYIFQCCAISGSQCVTTSRSTASCTSLIANTLKKRCELVSEQSKSNRDWCFLSRGVTVRVLIILVWIKPRLLSFYLPVHLLLPEDHIIGSSVNIELGKLRARSVCISVDFVLYDDDR